MENNIVTNLRKIAKVLKFATAICSILLFAIPVTASLINGFKIEVYLPYIVPCILLYFSGYVFFYVFEGFALIIEKLTMIENNTRKESANSNYYCNYEQ